MSAPNTDLQKQQHQHRVPLWGIWGGLGLVAAMFLVWLSWVFAGGQMPERPQTVIDDFTGRPMAVNPDAALERVAQTLDRVPPGAD
ncbi:hypothetical protein M4578_01095 [Salipiger sp. P9]|uniref:hypothetical protein n=1 Tax=Salipiger pentaromativorans TaxID=2943193 RepID=UPI002157ACD7|nr:hypothetical protein [Salipiger pentaromativorans]MCR8546406.1 hypothetical protein [Salipiger pentaromativorans]